MNEYRYEDISVGHRESFSKEVTDEMLRTFSVISGDENPLHSDDSYARALGYDGRVAFGMLTASLLSALAGMYLPGKNSLIHRVECDFPLPVFVGDILTVEGEVKEKNDLFQILDLKVVIRNQEGHKVLRGKMRVGVSK